MNFWCVIKLAFVHCFNSVIISLSFNEMGDNKIYNIKIIIYMELKTVKITEIIFSIDKKSTLNDKGLVVLPSWTDLTKYIKFVMTPIIILEMSVLMVYPMLKVQEGMWLTSLQWLLLVFLQCISSYYWVFQKVWGRNNFLSFSLGGINWYYLHCCCSFMSIVSVHLYISS